MPEQKRKLPLFGRDVDVMDVPATISKEYFNEYELEDGTILRAKGVATAFLRVEGQFLPDGRPVYLVLMSPTVDVISSPKGKALNATPAKITVRKP